MLCSEEKLINYLLFDSDKLEKIEMSKLNFDKFVKISSQHLILPTLYSNIIRKKIEKSLPKDLLIYLREIFDLNKERNKILYDEVKYISEIFCDSNITHVFLKGTAGIFGEIYENIGERMIGDIDILILQKDKDVVFDLIKKKGYKNLSKYNFFLTKK